PAAGSQSVRHEGNDRDRRDKRDRRSDRSQDSESLAPEAREQEHADQPFRNAKKPTRSTEYVRPYSRGQKNDFRDAEAIAEAVQRPTMKFVATKTADQLDLQALHRVRE